MAGFMYGAFFLLDQDEGIDPETHPIVVYAIIAGFVVYKIVYQVIEMATECGGLEPLSPFDSITLLDDQKSLINIMGASFFEKFEYESMRKYLIEKTENVHRMRSKLHKFMGMYWYKKLTKEEFEARLDHFISRRDDIHTKDQLIELMLHEQTIRDPLDYVQMRFILIPEYEGD